MRPHPGQFRGLVPLLAGLAVACGLLPGSQVSAPPASAPSAEQTPAASARTAGGRSGEFSADRAWAHLTALTGFGPRSVGSAGNAQARAYLKQQLEAIGLQPELRHLEVQLPDPSGEGWVPAPDRSPESTLVNVIARIPGTRSDDLIVLVAPYDSAQIDGIEFLGANDGASGSAVLLELARILASEPLPYTTEIVFLDGEGRFVGTEAREYQGVGSTSLVNRLQPDAGRVRLLVFVNRVGDADLQIARDLMSHRFYRQEFWKAASRTGHSAAFPPEAEFTPADARDKLFLRGGLRRVVSIVDVAFGGDQPPGLYANTEDDDLDRCSPESLEAVGVVTLEALGSISDRLVRIDRFASTPNERNSGAGDRARTGDGAP